MAAAGRHWLIQMFRTSMSDCPTITNEFDGSVSDDCVPVVRQPTGIVNVSPD